VVSLFGRERRDKEDGARKGRGIPLPGPSADYIEPKKLNWSGDLFVFFFFVLHTRGRGRARKKNQPNPTF
jgi:hypothetical protein